MHTEHMDKLVKYIGSESVGLAFNGCSSYISFTFKYKKGTIKLA